MTARSDARERLAAQLAGDEDRLPSNLSAVQSRLEFLQRLAPETARNRVAVRRLDGKLDAAVLQQAVASVVQRHESLRTRFVRVADQPLRIVLATVGAIPVHFADVDGDEELHEAVTADSRRPFELEQAPLMRVAVFRVAGGTALVVVAHQLAADARSMEIVMADLADAYAELRGGTASDWEAPRQFAEVAAELQRRDQAEEHRLEAWWRDRLAGVEPLGIATDRPRPALQPLEPVSAERSLSATLEDGDAATAAWVALLRRYARQDEVVVAIPIANRDCSASATVGPLEDVVPVRVACGDDPTFATLVQRVHHARSEASLSRLPFAQILRATAPGRDLSRAPLAQTSVRFIEEAIPVGEVPWRASSARPATVDMDLALELTGATAQLHAPAELFDAATVGRMLDHFDTLLSSGLAEPEDRISALAVSDDAERRLLDGWAHGVAVDLPASALHELFAEQVRQTPGAEAVRFGEERITYKALDRRVAAMAARLRHAGASRGTVVGIALRRSPALVEAILAVLKVGAAYVPIDLAYPPERVEAMLTDARASLVVCDGEPLGDRPVVRPGYGDPEGADAAAVEDAAASPSDVAYVLFTSGSTGRPKGVAVTHRNVVNYVVWAASSYRPTEGDGAPLHSSIAFDLTVTSLFVPLLTGAAVTLVPEDDEHGVEALAAVLAGGGFSYVKLTPAHVELLSQTLTPSQIAQAAQRLVIGGEALSGQMLSAWARYGPEVRIVNEYGPTEATVGCCAYEVAAGETAPGAVPIGRPIANTSLYVLDEGGEPTAIGVPGELYIGGAGVARGYVGRDDLTRERFVTRPCAGEQVLYRTGDLVRWRGDGRLEFVGRADEQVKIQGYRIELGEIASVIEEHAAVRQAVVDAPGTGGEKRLIGYVVPANGKVPRDELIELAQRRLPDYMVPRQFVEIESVPLTTNGKLDRRRLPAPETDRPDLDTPYVAPRTPLEEDIARSFARALGLDRVGVHDDFFVLGAHSMMIAELSSRMSRAYQVDLPVAYFFQTASAAGLARMIELYQTQGREVALASTGALDLNAEAVLEPEITPAGLPPAYVGAPRRVLLTGATGFLGAFVLLELLCQTEAEIVCLSRGEDDAHARERLLQLFEKYSIKHPALDERVVVIRADLAKPHLGLSDEAWDELAETIDAIYHSGALVNFVYPYAALKATNVEGTREVLKLACTTRAKTLHHVSAVDVFVSRDSEGDVMREEDPLDPSGVPHGYVQSKWVAERLATTARERGLPVAIYRPWVIMGHSETGTCHETDYMAVSLKGSLQLREMPDLDMYVDVMPIDYVSRALVYMSLQPGALGKIFHFANHGMAHLREVYNWLRDLGYELRLVPWEEWRETAINVDQSNALFSIAPLNREEPYHQELNPRIDCTNTEALLEGSGITCPPVNAELLGTIVGYLVSSGFMEAPEGGLRSRAEAVGAA